jgi:hypothetical protein
MAIEIAPDGGQFAGTGDRSPAARGPDRGAPRRLGDGGVSPAEKFLAQFAEDAETDLGLGRLVRMGKRLQAIAEALREDPGHGITGAVCKPTQDRTKAVYNWLRMGRALLADVGPFEPGECRVCGCTELDPCDKAAGTGAAWTSCGWALSNRTLCDSRTCVEAAASVGHNRDGGPAFSDGVDDEAVLELVDHLDAVVRQPVPGVYAPRTNAAALAPECYGAGCDEFPGLRR